MICLDLCGIRRNHGRDAEFSVGTVGSRGLSSKSTLSLPCQRVLEQGRRGFTASWFLVPQAGQHVDLGQRFGKLPQAGAKGGRMAAVRVE